MGSLSVDFALFRVFIAALAIGLLVGVERYKARSPDKKEAAGVRTFTLFAFLGAIAGFIDQMPITLALFGAVTLILAISYVRTSESSPGITTEFAALIVFWLGFLIHLQESLAIGLAILLTLVLAAKAPIHGFVRERITETEVFDTLKFLAVVLVVYPVLPDRSLGPGGFFNPKTVWLFVVLVSTISYGGYLFTRWLGSQRGLALSGLAGGLVSTVAVTLSLSQRARENPEVSRICGETAVLANAMQFPRLLLLIWVAAPVLGRELLWPFLAAFIVALVGALLIWRYERSAAAPDVELDLSNPFSVTPALKFGALFAVILFVTELANRYLGIEGLYVASAVSGLGNVSAIALSVARLVAADDLALASATTAIMIAIAANMVTKVVLAWTNGTRELTFWMGGGVATMVATAILALVLQ